MNKIKHFVLPLLGIAIFSACQNGPKNNENNNEESPVLTPAEAKAKGYIFDDDAIRAVLNAASLPKGLVPVGDNAPLDKNDGVPIIIDEDNNHVEKSEFTEFEGVPGYWVKSKTRYRMSHSFDETLIKDPKADILYPGAVLRGNTIADATYGFFTACNTGEAQYSISRTLKKGNGDLLTGKANNIRMSNYRAQFNNWKQLEFSDDDAINTSCNIYHIDSKEDAKFHAGASVKHQIADVVANLDFKFSQKKNHFLVKFVQENFNVTLDQPIGRATIFTSINPKMMENVQPVYVSNIKYGRILFIAVSTNESEATVNAAVECMLKKIKGVDVNAQLETAYTNLKSSSDISLTVIGGSQDQHNNVIGNTDLEGAMTYMKAKVGINQVAPISFQLRYASTGAIARIVTQTEYEVPNNIFVPAFDKVIITVRPISIRATGGWQGENDIFGNSFATSTTEDGSKQPHQLFNIENSTTMRVNNQNVFTDLSGSNVQFTFIKPQGVDPQDFLVSNHIKFDLNLTERFRNGNHRKYQKAEDTFSLSDLINIYNTDKGMGPCFTISTQTDGYTAGVKYRVMDVQYASNGRTVNGKKSK